MNRNLFERRVDDPWKIGMATHAVMSTARRWRLRPRHVGVVEPLRNESGATHVEVVATPRPTAPVARALENALLYVDDEGRVELAFDLRPTTDPSVDAVADLVDLEGDWSLPGLEVDRSRLVGTWREDGSSQWPDRYRARRGERSMAGSTRRRCMPRSSTARPRRWRTSWPTLSLNRGLPPLSTDRHTGRARPCPSLRGA